MNQEAWMNKFADLLSKRQTVEFGDNIKHTGKDLLDLLGDDVLDLFKQGMTPREAVEVWTQPQPE